MRACVRAQPDQGCQDMVPACKLKASLEFAVLVVIDHESAVHTYILVSLLASGGDWTGLDEPACSR